MAMRKNVLHIILMLLSVSGTVFAQTYIYDFSGLNCMDDPTDSLVRGIGNFVEFKDTSCMLPRHIVSERGGSVAVLYSSQYVTFKEELEHAGELNSGLIELRLPPDLELGATYRIEVIAMNMHGCVFTPPNLIVKRRATVNEKNWFDDDSRYLCPNGNGEFGVLDPSLNESRNDGRLYIDTYWMIFKRGDRFLLVGAGGSEIKNCARYIDYVLIERVE